MSADGPPFHSPPPPFAGWRRRRQDPAQHGASVPSGAAAGSSAGREQMHWLSRIPSPLVVRYLQPLYIRHPGWTLPPRKALPGSPRELCKQRPTFRAPPPAGSRHRAAPHTFRFGRRGVIRWHATCCCTERQDRPQLCQVHLLCIYALDTDLAADTARTLLASWRTPCLRPLRELVRDH